MPSFLVFDRLVDVSNLTKFLKKITLQSFNGF